MHQSSCARQKGKKPKQSECLPSLKLVETDSADMHQKILNLTANICLPPSPTASSPSDEPSAHRRKTQSASNDCFIDEARGPHARAGLQQPQAKSAGEEGSGSARDKPKGGTWERSYICYGLHNTGGETMAKLAEFQAGALLQPERRRKSSPFQHFGASGSAPQ